jgi:hypothetical protein
VVVVLGGMQALQVKFDVLVKLLADVDVDGFVDVNATI